MAKHLTIKNIDALVALIDVWEGKLTWEAQKARIKAGHIPSKRPASLSIAEQRIRRLEGENNRLKEDNDRLLERFIRWQYNAYKFGMSKEKLEAPLPEIDRDSSEKRRSLALRVAR
jgi:hypothetical protein